MNSSTNPVDIRADHLEIVRDILSAHLPAGFQFWVFGSRATWTTKDSSDLDLAVAGPSRLDHRTMADLEIAFEESDLPYTVDVVDLNAVSPEFREIVESQKVLLLPNRGRLSTHREWREASLGEVIELKRGYDLPQRNRIPGNAPVVSSAGITDWHSEAKVKGPGVVTGRYGTLGEIYFIQDDFWPLNTALYVRDFKGNDPKFVSYFLSGLDFFAYSDKAAVPGLNRNHLHEATVRYPTDVVEQRAIAHILGTLDDKIELNRRMNQTLDEMACAIFQDWFVDFGPVRAKLAGREPYLPPELWSLFPDRLVPSELGEIPEGWEVRSLDDIAVYRNGLALQKFRPEGAEDRLPAVKIAQLRSGQADAGEWAKADIPSDCIIDDGDVVFSWSGSLMIKIWCGGRAALNQHLFKVTSQKYPKWFYFRRIEENLADFQDIAADKATTMGHIKREHLRYAKCAVPCRKLLGAADGTFADLLSQQITLTLHSSSLASQRNALLPKLVSGKVGVRNGFQKN